MLSRRIAAARPLSRLVPIASQTPALAQRRWASSSEPDPEVTDPDMNGGYVNPPRQKRQFRDPYGDWWDKQERRNYGEPIHEDNDVLAQFTPHEYTHMPPGHAFFLVGCFVAAVLGLAGVTSIYYPDKPSVPKTYEGGLDKELGGEGALRAPTEGDEWNGGKL